MWLFIFLAFPITAKRANSVFSPLFSFPTFIRNYEVFLKWGRLHSKQNWRCPAYDSSTKSTISLDCKTVSLFLKIGLVWCKASVRTSRVLHVRASHANRVCALPSLALCFQSCSRPFVWLFVSTWIWKKNWLLCSLQFPSHQRAKLRGHWVIQEQSPDPKTWKQQLKLGNSWSNQEPG